MTPLLLAQQARAALDWETHAEAVLDLRRERMPEDIREALAAYLDSDDEADRLEVERWTR